MEHGKFLAIAAFFCALQGLGAEGRALAMAPLPEEAPASLFDVQFGGAEAEFLLKGSWQIGLTAQAGLIIDKDGSASMAPDVPLVPSQIPDLFLSFRLFDKLFVETRVSPDPSQIRYSVGYRGAEDEFLKEVRLGNEGISFPTFPFLSLGQGSWRSFGAAASIGGPSFSGRAMLRYDQASKVERHFVGNRETTESVIAASEMVRGRWFVLPAVPPSSSSLSVFVRSAAGTINGDDGQKYRQLDPTEYSYSSTTGLLALAKTATTVVAASYPGATDLAFSSLGKNADYFFDPDYVLVPRDSSRLALCRYAATASSEDSDAFVRDRATGLPDTGYEVRLDMEGYAEVSDLSAGAVDPQDSQWRQPFINDISWLYDKDFSEDNTDASIRELPKEIVVRSYRPAERISIDKDVVEGSVEVYRNGIPDYAFSVDTESGILTLATPPGLGEEIDIAYLLASAERSSGSLAAGLGGLFDLGGGVTAWTALGMRLSVPGASYAQAGVLDPGSLVLAAGEEKKEGKFRHSIALGASWSTKEASGLYRIDGMEGDSTGTSYRPEPYSATPGFSIAAVADSALAAGFGSLVDSLHSDGSPQQALVISVTGSGDFEAVRYIEAPPCSSMKSLSFFARTSAGTSATGLAVSIDTGDGTPELTLQILSGDLSTSWRRYTLRYADGSQSLYWQDTENGPKSALIGATSTVDLSLANASRLAIRIVGAAAGDEIFVDEILLEDSVGSASLAVKAGASYEDADWALGQGAIPVLSTVKVAADLSGGVADTSWASGGASLSTMLGPFGITMRARGRFSEDGLFVRGGHELSLPGMDFPIALVDSFDSDPETGGFGRTDRLSIAVGKAMAISAGQESIWSPPGSAEDGMLSQSWSGKLGVGSGIFALDAAIASVSRPASLELGGGYFERWYGAFAYMLPQAESAATKRSLSATAVLGLGGDREIARASLKASAQPAASAPLRDEAYAMKVQAPLQLGESLLISPYYQRSWTGSRLGGGGDLAGFLGLASVDVADFSLLWSAAPMAELFDTGTAVDFSSEAQGFEKSSYAPELGILLARSEGSTWRDLLLPSSLSLAFTRTLSLDGDTLTDVPSLKFGARMQAENLFGEFGSHPLGLAFESDEYRTNLLFDWSLAGGAAQARYSALLQTLVTLYGNGNRDSLNFDNRYSYARDPAGPSWSERLGFSLSKVVEKHWLLAVYKAATRPKEKADTAVIESPGSGDGGDQAGDRKISVASSYIQGLAAQTPSSRVLWAVDLGFVSSATDSKSASLGLEAEESVEWRVTIPQKLSLSCKPALVQQRSASTGVTSIGFKAVLSMTVTF